MIHFCRADQTEVGSAGEQPIRDKSVDRRKCQKKEGQLRPFLIFAEVCHALKNSSISFIFRFMDKPL